MGCEIMTPVLEVKKLEVAFSGMKQEVICLDKINFSLKDGEILCLVGESGSGKSVTALSIMGLLGKNGRITDGEILFQGKPLVNQSGKYQEGIRGKEISMIFQDIMTSLNPVFTIGFQMVETLTHHLKINKQEAKVQAIQLLEKVGLTNPELIMKKFPHTLSGGMRQRVMIAMALACRPRILIADEPTTALDVTIQAQIMTLLKQLKEEYKMSIILVTHDMGVVAEMADRVLVMYAGQIVEEASVLDIFEHPAQPYTKALLQAIPSSTDKKIRRLLSIEGTVPETYQNITGCRFANRCPYTDNENCEKEQQLVQVGVKHFARCWRNN